MAVTMSSRSLKAAGPRRVAAFLLVVAWDALGIVAMSGCLLTAMARPALAYVDPSVMTYTIQALAAVAVALSAVLGVAFRRTRRVIMRLLRIDADAGRVAEPAVSRIDPAEKPVADAQLKGVSATGRAGGAHAKPRSSHSPSWGRRLVSGLLVGALFSITLMISAPYELIAGNSASLVFSLTQVWQVFVLPAVVVTLAIAVVLTLLRERAFNAGLMAVFGVTLASYIQALFLNGNLPSADGSSVDWTTYTVTAVWTTAVWVAVLVAPFKLSCVNRSVAQGIVSLLAAALIVVQGVGVGSLFASDSASVTKETTNYTMTERGLFTVSPKKNIIVFVLDMYDTSMDLIPAVEQNPGLLGEMTGFTWYQNSTAVVTPTRNAIPTMLAGQQRVNSAVPGYAEGHQYLTDLVNAGYDVGLYSDILPVDEPYYRDSAFNIIANGGRSADTAVNIEGTLRMLYNCVLFRDLPWPFKPFFWFYTDDINQAMVKTSELSVGEVDPNRGSDVPYTTNDVQFASNLNSIGLAAVDQGETGAFRFIHLNGAHYPYTMDQNGQAGSDLSRAQQAEGSMNTVSAYLRQLKELGLYDDAMVIVTADHGFFASSDPLALTDFAANPIMLVKPSETHEQASRPYVTSQQPVSNADVLPTALAGLGCDKSEYGVNMLAQNDFGRVRYFSLLSKDDEGVEHGLVEYEIAGDANDIDNWHPTGWINDFSRGAWVQRGQ